MAGDLCSFSPLFPLIYMPCNNQYNNESALHVVFLPVGYASVFYPILLYFRRIPGVNCHLNAVHLIFPCYTVRGIFFLFRRVWMNWRPVALRSRWVVDTDECPGSGISHICFLWCSLYDKAWLAGEMVDDGMMVWGATVEMVRCGAVRWRIVWCNISKANAYGIEIFFIHSLFAPVL